MATHFTAHSRGPGRFVRLERQAFAAKIRLARAVLGWSQSELGRRVGLTQRAIHKLEQGGTEPRRATVHALEQTWREQNIEFEDLAEVALGRTFAHPLSTCRQEIKAHLRKSCWQNGRHPRPVVLAFAIIFGQWIGPWRIPNRLHHGSLVVASPNCCD